MFTRLDVEMHFYLVMFLFTVELPEYKLVINQEQL